MFLATVPFGGLTAYSVVYWCYDMGSNKESKVLSYVVPGDGKNGVEIGMKNNHITVAMKPEHKEFKGALIMNVYFNGADSMRFFYKVS